MSEYHHHCPPPHPGTAGNAGLIGVFGGVINLATTVLYSGAKILRTVVEGAIWEDDRPHCHCGCAHVHHVHHVRCEPENHSRCDWC